MLRLNGRWKAPGKAISGHVANGVHAQTSHAKCAQLAGKKPADSTLYARAFGPANALQWPTMVGFVGF